MRNQEYLTLKERLEILFGIRGAPGERAVRKKELDALNNRVTRMREELDALESRVSSLEGP